MLNDFIHAPLLPHLLSPDDCSFSRRKCGNFWHDYNQLSTLDNLPLVARLLNTPRYVVEEPIELNRYVYAANNPILFTDPSGLNFVEMSTKEETVTVPSIPGLDILGKFFGALHAQIITYAKWILVIAAAEVAYDKLLCEEVGWHGTSLRHVWSIVTQIDPPDNGKNQLGYGFYVTPELGTAKFYAGEALEDSRRKGWNDVQAIIPVCAYGFSGMTHTEVPRKVYDQKPVALAQALLFPYTLDYDYLTAPTRRYPGTQIKFNPRVFKYVHIRGLGRIFD